jgi:hypothetical protein
MPANLTEELLGKLMSWLAGAKTLSEVSWAAICDDSAQASFF